MLLKQQSTGKLIDVVDVQALINPFHSDVSGQLQWGEDLSDPENFSKSDLCFLSGEVLPTCWRNAHYRDHKQSARLSSMNSEASNYYGA